jgi:hypothetical protein
LNLENDYIDYKELNLSNEDILKNVEKKIDIINKKIENLFELLNK